MNRPDNIFEACSKGDLGGVKRIIEAIDIYGRTPLNISCYNGHIEVVKFLLEEGADIESKDRCSNSPLNKASCYEGDLETVKFLVEKGSDIESRDIYERTPLNNACVNRLLEVVKFLVEKGSDIESRDFKGYSFDYGFLY